MLLIQSGVLSLQVLEAVDLQMLDQAVEFLLGVFVIVLLAAHPNADLAGNILDTSVPDKAVQAGVDTDVLCEHFGLSEPADVANGAGSSLFKLDTLEAFVQVDGVVSGHLLHLLLLTVFNSWHLF